MPLSIDDLPKYHELMYPVLRAVNDLGGSGSGNEITARVIENEGMTDEQLAVMYSNRPTQSVLVDRLDWARSYCKLSGALDSPKRKLFLITPLGREVLALPEADARSRLHGLDRLVRARRPKKAAPAEVSEPDAEPDVEPDVEPDEIEDDRLWQDALLQRLHALTPTGFEEFCIYLLREFDMELKRVGGPNDEGIDGIGTAPLSEVLSATVAIQVKRYDPAGDRAPIGRSTVALFQRDASSVGAERAVLITLGRFSSAAEKAATTSTPRVDLIDGRRLCELVLSKELGVTLSPVVDAHWFDRFD